MKYMIMPCLLALIFTNIDDAEATNNRIEKPAPFNIELEYDYKHIHDKFNSLKLDITLTDKPNDDLVSQSFTLNSKNKTLEIKLYNEKHNKLIIDEHILIQNITGHYLSLKLYFNAGNGSEIIECKNTDNQSNIDKLHIPHPLRMLKVYISSIKNSQPQCLVKINYINDKNMEEFKAKMKEKSGMHMPAHSDIVIKHSQ